MKFLPTLSRLLLLAGVGAAPPAVADTLLVRNALLITGRPADDQAFAGWFTVGDDGRITALAAGAPPAGLTAGRMLDAGGKFVAPGFISAHSHIYMSPLRGLGHTETLYGWIQSFQQFTSRATAEDLYWFSLHGALDFLRNGITTAYDFTHSGTEGAISGGGRAPTVIQLPGPFEENQIKAKADAGLRFIDSFALPETGTRAEKLARIEALLAWTRENYGANPLSLRMAISGTVQWAPTRATAEFEAYVMKTYGLLNQSHFLESPEFVPAQQAKFAWYEDAGALGPNFIFGHFIQTTPDIVRRAAKAGATMSWQPSSNSRLASGVADTPLYEAMGIKVAVGLDDQSCTDISDPFQNLRIGMALIRTQYKDAKAMSVRHMLYLHTLGSAEVLGVADKVGSLEPGKFADFLVVDPRSPDTGPLHDAVATYVLACSLRNLKQVYVGGKLVADGEKMLTYDESAVRQHVDGIIARISADIAAGVPAPADVIARAAAAQP